MLKLSEFDPTSHYRTINRAEFTALWKAGQLVNKFASMCLIENGVAYGGKPDGTIDANPPYICPAEEMLTVREHK